MELHNLKPAKGAVKNAKRIISDRAITAPGKAYVSETISLK